MKTRKLITCNDAFRARLIQGALENEDIPSVLHNENTSNVLRGFVSNVSGVDVFVYEDDYEAAVRLLERNQMLPEQLKYCPRCGSEDIKFRLKKGGRWRAALAAVATMLTAVPPGSEHWEYVCNSCGARFNMPVAHPSEATEENDATSTEPTQRL